MGESVNSAEAGDCPSVSPDGKYSYYTQGGDIMWVYAWIIDSYGEEARPSAAIRV